MTPNPKSQTDIVAAILTHVSLMLATLAFIFQLAEKVMAASIDIARAAGIVPPDQTPLPSFLRYWGSWKTPEEIPSSIAYLKHFTSAQILYSYFAYSAFIYIFFMLVIWYLFLAMRCLTLLVENTDQSSAALAKLLNDTRRATIWAVVLFVIAASTPTMFNLIGSLT
jgi:hypothetical protein